MTTYDRLWTGCAALVGAASLAVALRSYSPPVLLMSFLSTGLLAALTVLPFLPADSAWTEPLVRVGVVGGLLIVLLMGSARLAGGPGAVVVLVVAVPCPALAPAYRFVAGALGWSHRPRRRVAPPAAGTAHPAAPTPAQTPALDEPAPEGPAPEGPPLDVPDLMTDKDLCIAWRSSYVALQRAASVESRLRVVTVRALYLDELERRAGPAVRAWLGSGPRAASDPSRFLSGTRRRRRQPPSLAE